MDHAVHVVRDSAQTRQGVVGRTAELESLEGSLRQLQSTAGLPCAVTVTGDPGIGKTALLAEFADLARSRDMVVATGRAGASRGTPLGVVADAFDEQRELVRTVLSEWPRERREQMTRVLQGEHSGHGPAGAGTGAGAGPDFRIIHDLIESLARPGLVLILDDVHAADPDSLGLVATLLRRPPRARLLILLGYRDRQVPARLRTAIHGRSERVAVEHLHLSPLSEQDADLLLADTTAIRRKELYRHSGGNPGYLRMLTAERSADASAGILDELASLAPDVRRTARAAAIIGSEFDAELLTRVLDESETTVLAALGALVRCDLVRPVAGSHHFVFRHATVHRAVEETAELAWRIGIHTRADEALRARDALPTERARHVDSSIRFGDLEAVDVLCAAARAVAATEPARAVAWLRTALRVLPCGAEFAVQRARLRVELARSVTDRGGLREARELMQEALRVLPREPAAEHAEAVVFAATVQRMLGAREETEVILRTKVDGHEDQHGAVVAALKCQLAAGQLYTVDHDGRAVRWAEEALAAARGSGHHALQASCLGLLALVAAAEGRVEAAVGRLADAARVVDGMHDDELAGSLNAVLWIGWSEVLCSAWDDALRHFRKAVEFATRTGHLLYLPHLLVGLAYVLRTRGELAEAQATAEHAVHLAEEAECLEGVINAHAMKALVDISGGRTENALASALTATLPPRHSASNWKEAMALRVLAEARLASGDHEGCIATVSEAGGPELPTSDAGSRPVWYELLTRAELAADRYDRAAHWAARAAAVDRTGAVADLARAQVLLRTVPGQALPPAQRAVAGLESSGRVIDALRARTVLGLALWHQDRFDDAARELKAAETALDQCGAVLLARAARQERRRLAARVPRGRGGPGGPAAALVLTTRERQIAELVGDGLTNRLIAKQLHIAEKTVEMHLSRVFAKLGVSNRAAVAAAVSREPVG
ncbi:AAA family ATPase [Kitasatospora sp. NPDC056076]|uniref:AAA family ATPase n=1 Tax=Kitasatospora sp. NPDC056076 TaxID=3345703 RepID=UPI0035E2D658